MTPTVVIYDRLSRLFADERPDHRIKTCADYAAQRGWRVIHTATDTNVSGASALEDREGMREVLDRLPQADFVLAAKLDRYARSVLEFQRLLKVAKEHSASVITADGMVSPENASFIVNVLAAFAEWERETIITRITESKAYFKQRGNHLGGLAPYGYRVVGPVNDKRWEIDPVPAEILREMADRLINKGASVASLARELNERQIPPPQEYARQRDGRERKPRKDGTPHEPQTWHGTTLRDVLYTPAVRGWLVQADDSPGVRRSALTNHYLTDAAGNPISVGPEVLDGDTWSAVRTVLDGKSIGRGIARGGPGLLLHIARCGDCGGPMYRSHREERGKDYSNLFCKRGADKNRPEQGNSIAAIPTEEHVSAEFLRKFGIFRFMRWVEPDGSAATQLAEVNQQIDRLADSLSRLPDGRARRRVEDQLSGLERRAEELAETADAQQGRWEPTGRTLAQEWELRDTEGRRALLSELGASVSVAPHAAGAPRRFNAERLTLSFSGPEWARVLEPDEDILADIAHQEA